MNACPKPDIIAVIAIIACALVILGEVAVYNPGTFDYSTETNFDTGEVSYVITTSGAKTYAAILTDGGLPCERLYIYDDVTYVNHYDEVKAEGVRHKDMGFVIDQLIKSLEIRGFTGIEICGRDALAVRLASDMSSGTADKAGVLALSYALPGNIYSGNPGDPLMKWIFAGGKLYWSGGNIGRYYTEDNDLKIVDANQNLFFGKQCVNTGQDVAAYTKIDAGGITDALYLKNNNTRFGIDVSGLPDATSFGYMNGGYSSISSVKYGLGSICVIAGDYNYNQRDDIAQMVASGISCGTKVLGIDSGTTGRGVSHFSMAIPTGSWKLCLYISVGGTYIVHGGATIGP